MHKRAISFLLSAVILLGMLCGAAPVARAASDFVTSDTCVSMIKDIEGFSKYPYYDNGQYTIGYGTTCPPEEYERYNTYGITEEEAEESLREHLESYENTLNSFIDKNGLSMDQGKFDALLSFTYNVGTAWTRSESTFRTAVLSGATGNDFIFAIGRWCTASGKVLKSLIERRLIEANMYLNGVYADAAPSNYRYVVFNDNLSGASNDVRVQAYDANIGDRIRSVPTAEGYTFQGWYTEPTGGIRVTVLDASVNATTLYAHWSAGEGAPAETEPEAETQPDDQEPETPLDEGVVNTERLNVRSAAGTWNALVGYAYEGDVVKIYEITNLGGVVWGRINGGWVSLDYVTLNSAQEEEPSEPTEAPTEPAEPAEPTEPVEPEKIEETVIAKGTVTVKALNIRSEASTGSKAVGSVSRGTEVEIYEINEIDGVSWGRIDRGWISLEHVEWARCIVATGTVNTEKLNVRSGAGTSNALVAYYYEGDVVEIYETTEVRGVTWGRAELGWISLEYVSFGVAAPKLNVTNIESTGKIRIEWDEVDGAEGYEVYRSATEDGEFTLLKKVSGTRLNHTSAAVGETWYYKVKAAGVEDAPFSEAASGTCKVAQPEVTVSNLENGKIRIDWDSEKGANGYEVYYATEQDGEYTLLKKVSSSALNHTSAKAGVTYYYKVVALGPESELDSVASEVCSGSCGMPKVELSIRLSSSGKPRLSWNRVPGAEKYRVYRSVSEDGSWKLLNNVRGTAMTNISAKSGATYYYKVVAVLSNTTVESDSVSITAE